MVSRNHNNRSEKQKGHAPVHQGAHPSTSQEGHQGSETMRDRSGTDERHDGKSRINGVAMAQAARRRSRAKAKPTRAWTTKAKTGVTAEEALMFDRIRQ